MLLAAGVWLGGVASARAADLPIEAICSGSERTIADAAFDRSEAGLAAWAEYQAWARDEVRRQTDAERGKILAVRPDPTVNLEPGCFRSIQCEAVLALDQLRRTATIEEYIAAKRETGALCGVLQSYGDLIDRRLAKPTLAVEEQLALLTLRTQALRALAFDVDQGTKFPSWTRSTQQLAKILIKLATIRADLAGVDYIRARLTERAPAQVLAEQSDPRRYAFLLVQHADRDPALQLHVLADIEDNEQVRRGMLRQYSYLFDRVNLRLYGRQRFGTQLQCAGGSPEPVGLEAPATVNARRAEVGLEPLEQYQKTLLATCVAKAP